MQGFHQILLAMEPPRPKNLGVSMLCGLLEPHLTFPDAYTALLAAVKLSPRRALGFYRGATVYVPIEVQAQLLHFHVA